MICGVIQASSVAILLYGTLAGGFARSSGVAVNTRMEGSLPLALINLSFAILSPFLTFVGIPNLERARISGFYSGNRKLATLLLDWKIPEAPAANYFCAISRALPS
jgi:hypothetical protein